MEVSQYLLHVFGMWEKTAVPENNNNFTQRGVRTRPSSSPPEFEWTSPKQIMCEMFTSWWSMKVHFDLGNEILVKTPGGFKCNTIQYILPPSHLSVWIKILSDPADTLAWCVHVCEREIVRETKERQRGWAGDELAKIYGLSVTLIRLSPAAFISGAAPRTGHWPAAGQPTNHRLPWLRQCFNCPVITMEKADSF